MFYVLTIVLLSLASAADGQGGELQEWEAHIEGLRRQAEREPSNPNHLLRVAQAYAHIGDTPRVIEVARLAERRGAHPAQCAFLLGDHYLQVHRFDLAVSSYERGLRLAPRNGQGWARLWKALFELRRSVPNPTIDVAMAAANLESHGYYFPGNWRQPGAVPATDDARARRLVHEGYRSLQGRDPVGAVRAFRRAIDASPVNPEAFRGLGIAHARQRRLQQALGAYQLFLALAEPRHPDVGRIRAILFDYFRSLHRLEER